MLDRTKQETMAVYSKKYMTAQEVRNHSEMKVILYAAVHNLPLWEFDHLIKTLKSAFPDSELVKSIKMAKTSASYHLTYGLAKTENEILDLELSSTFYSASLDGGAKGNKKRTEIFVKFWSSSRARVVEMFFAAVTLNVETAASVQQAFISILKDRGILLSNLINLHTDSCAILRGRHTGALKRIGVEAPKILQTDIGGDALHHVHNAAKKSFVKVFNQLDGFIKNIKYDIRSSPAKLERYLEVCEEVGEPRRFPLSYCTSRFLDKYQAIVDCLEHTETLKAYYSSCPSGKRNINVSSEDEIESDVDEDTRISQNLKGSRVEKMQMWLLDPTEAIFIETNLLVAKDCLKNSYDFLRIFQSGSVKIHILYSGMKDLLRQTLLEIVEPSALMNSKGDKLDGKDLKSLVLETKEERQQRRAEEDAGKKKRSLSLKKTKTIDYQRHAQLLPISATLLSRDLVVNLNATSEKYNLKARDREELFTTIRGIKHNFQLDLARNFQHYFPLDNDFLRWLKYLCPKQFIEKAESEAYFVKVAKTADLLSIEDEDDFRREVRHIKEFRDEVFGKELEVYLERYVDSFKLKDKEPNASIDSVWKKVIENELKFPLMSKVLKGALSIFHSTATVEGSINTTRNILGERAQRLHDKNLNARKVIKSAVKNSSAKCCFDYNVMEERYMKNWNNARGNYVKDNLKNQSVRDVSREEEDDSDPDNPHEVNEENGNQAGAGTDDNSLKDKKIKNNDDQENNKTMTKLKRPSNVKCGGSKPKKTLKDFFV